MRHALVFGLIFSVAPFHVGNAAAMAVPWVEQNFGWWVFIGALGLYTWALLVDVLGARKAEPSARRRHLLLHMYVFPVAGLTLLHLVVVAASGCGPEWAALGKAAGPPERTVEVRPGEVPPPPGGPPKSIRPFAVAALDLLASLVRAAKVFVQRLLAGTSWLLFCLAVFVAWLRRPAERR